MVTELRKDHTTGSETHGAGRKGVAEKTVLGGRYNDSGSVDKDLQRVASRLAHGKGAKRGLPAR